MKLTGTPHITSMHISDRTKVVRISRGYYDDLLQITLHGSSSPDVNLMYLALTDSRINRAKVVIK